MSAFSQRDTAKKELEEVCLNAETYRRKMLDLEKKV